ncbi:hypothetical protein CSKR_203798 [Clonorchis sinensis]|uniref:Uncharacterized protein n=1 Tax=Clonorchis sinensis TaxID=79923 RepID=A0A8T1N0Y6_CLOSI|nr:hypothetical protein CSKR_203798 [Clonorchis sinensis]
MNFTHCLKSFFTIAATSWTIGHSLLEDSGLLSTSVCSLFLSVQAFTYNFRLLSRPHFTSNFSIQSADISPTCVVLFNFVRCLTSSKSCVCVRVCDTIRTLLVFNTNRSAE